MKKMMMKTMRRVFTAATTFTLAGVVPLSGQGVVVEGQACESGIVEGDLGITGMDCVGECTINLRGDGTEDRWEFSTEPVIFSIEKGSPADGVLQSGDRIVAIDGLLITSREGGRRYANLTPGEMVTVRYRRNGTIHEAAMRARGHCRELPRPAAAVARVTPPSPPSEPEGVLPPTEIATAPRVRVTRGFAQADSARGTYASELGRATAGYVTPLTQMAATPRGRLGIGLSCSQCGTKTNQESGEEVWYFSGPIEVTQVNAGGPAEKAGIQLGDLIKAIDDHDVDTEAGGLAFSTLVPGESVRVTLVRRNGREETVDLVPSGPEAGYLRGRLAPPPLPPDQAEPPRAVATVVSPAPPAIPDRSETPAPGDWYAGPQDLPLSYSGTVEGVEVVVRGGPISVSEMRGARTIIINADGLWIRVRIPAGTVPSGGELPDTRR